MSTPLQDMRQLLRRDERFKVEAYQFIRESLQYAAEKLAASRNVVGPDGERIESSEMAGGELADDELDTVDLNHGELSEAEPTDDDLRDDSSDGLEPSPRHVTGGQLCHACREYGLSQYGFLAPMVLGNWGIHSTGDLGDLVYNLIGIGQMRKSASDRREDFDDVFDFSRAFEPEFEIALGENE